LIYDLRIVQQVISYLAQDVRMTKHRRNIAKFFGLFFGALFISGVGLETFLTAMMLSFLQVEVLGHVVTGAVFALLVPIVFAAAHIKMHSDGEWFINVWLRYLSSIGIFFFILGLAFTVGFSVWLAAEDNASEHSQAPSGVIGDHSFTSGTDTSSGIADFIAPIPNFLLFLGLSLAMIVSLYFASFCLGKVIDALTLLIEGPGTGKKTRQLIERAQDSLTRLRRLQKHEKVARRKLPFDKKHTFAREASQLCRRALMKKLDVGKRNFAAGRKNNLMDQFGDDKQRATIPDHFETYEEFARHIADQTDAVRVPYLLNVVTGFSPEGDKNDLV
ncbi:MAG: hypothetical protein GY761_16465, partial [Hyphomicrobiales bacterium]|nr:hypothetical protein [Hyphomicrobiales bacterium]